MRLLNDEFMNDLMIGKLYRLLETVKCDDALCLEIRNSCINIYYRGGSLFRVSQMKGNYFFKFDKNYCFPNKPLWETFDPSRLATVNEYVAAIPFLKREMDYWFYKHPKPEREYQQVILRENNLSSIAADTDYYIADIEYADVKNNSRFDMIGIKWLSNGPCRKNSNSPSLALFEVKYGDGAMTGSAGIVKHFTDIQKFIDAGKLESLIKEAQCQINQKVELGLIRGVSKTISIDKCAKTEFIIICANHKPASAVLERELQLAVDSCPKLFDSVDIKLALSSMVGYGLYKGKMISLNRDYTGGL